MRINQERIFSDDESSISIAFVNDRFVCFFVEDERRELKVPKETRIPEGSYQIKLRTVGGFHNRYSERFPEIHMGMLCLQDVPGFEHILIHCGNTEKNTDGCLLTNTGVLALPGSVVGQSSVVAYKRLYELVIEAAAHERLWIDIVDRDVL